MVKFGPINGSLLSNGRPFKFNPLMRYSDPPVSSERKSVRFTPTPRMEKGLMGVERYPFFGIKYEKDSPNCCACTSDVESITTRAIHFTFCIIFLNYSQ